MVQCSSNLQTMYIIFCRHRWPCHCKRNKPFASDMSSNQTARRPQVKSCKQDTLPDRRVSTCLPWQCSLHAYVSGKLLTECILASPSYLVHVFKGLVRADVSKGSWAQLSTIMQAMRYLGTGKRTKQHKAVRSKVFAQQNTPCEHF